jgi:hypothetical protein
MSLSARLVVVASLLTWLVAPDPTWGGHTRPHNKPEEMRAHMVEMHKQVDQFQKQIDRLLERAVGLAKLAYGIDRRAVRAPFGRYLLVRTETAVAAIQIVEHTRFRPGAPRWIGPVPRGARFLGYVGAPGANELSVGNAEEIRGEFSLESGNASDSELRVGDATLRWREGDWLELPPSNEARVEVAVTPFVRLEQVRFDSPLLQWMDDARLGSILAGREP